MEAQKLFEYFSSHLPCSKNPFAFFWWKVYTKDAFVFRRSMKILGFKSIGRER